MSKYRRGINSELAGVRSDKSWIRIEQVVRGTWETSPNESWRKKNSIASAFPGCRPGNARDDEARFE